MKLFLRFVLLCLISFSVEAAESLSYSGRLVQSNGAPVAGPVNLLVELSYTNAPSSILCNQTLNSVSLTNGVFHLKLDLDCGVNSLQYVLSNVPNGEAASLRVKDLTNNKTYAFQAIHSMPFANVAETAKQVVQMGATDGQVLKWNNTTKKWEPGAAGGVGTVTNVTVTAPLQIINGSSTPNISIPLANTTTNGYLSSSDWNTFNSKEGSIAAGTALQYYRGDKTWQTLNTSAVPENVNLYFTNARALGVPLTAFAPNNAAIIATDDVLTGFNKAQGQINAINTQAANFLIKNGTDSITGVVNVNTIGLLQLGYAPVGLTDAANKAYVDTKLDLTGGTLSGDLTLDTQIKFKNGGAANYITVKAPATGSTAYTLSLPLTAGSANQVLTTDGSGITSWTTPSTTATPTGAAGGDLAGTYPNPTIGTGKIADSHVSATAAIAQSKIANLATDLAGKLSNALTSANIFVGNGSNVATGVAMSGDATISNTGAVTLKNTGTAGTYTSVTTDAQGRVTAGTSPLASSSTTGSLTSADWNTFNNKQAALSAGATINGIVYPANGTQTLQVPLAPSAANDVVNKAYVDSFGQWTTSGGNVYRASGNVGIGTSIPTVGLEVSNGQLAANFKLSRSDGDVRYISFRPPNGVAGGAQVNVSGTAIAEYQSNGVVIGSSWTTGGNAAPANGLLVQGSVGIGTITPQSKLDVNGSVRVGADATACSAANAGAMRFTSPNVEYCNGAAWAAFSASGAAVGSAQISDGAIVDADINATAAIAATKIAGGTIDNIEFGYLDGITSNIQSQISNKQSADATLTALAIHNTNGIMVQTAADTFTGRTITGTANRLSVTNGDGVSGNPTLNIDTALLPSPIAGDAGKFLKATGADASSWGTITSSDVTTALGFTPVNKAGDTIGSGTFTFNGTSVLRTLDPIGLTDVATKQYVDSFGQWTAGGGNVYRTSGNVGIGKSNPSTMLDIVGNARATGGWTSNDGTSDVGKAYANSGAYKIEAIGASIPLMFAVNGSVRATIDTTGKVGMGTASPSSLLHLSGGNMQIGESTMTSGNPTLSLYGYSTPASSAKYGRLNVDSSGNFSLNAQGNYLVLDATSYIQVQKPLNFTQEALLFNGKQTLMTTNAGATLQLGSDSAYTKLDLGNANTTATVIPYGNVGIGTSTPTQKLTIGGIGSNAISQTPRGINLSTTELVGSTGDVGIQFNTPYNSGSVLTSNIRNIRGSSSTYIGLEMSTTTAHPIRFLTNSTGENVNERMRIESDGDIGIGTSTPQSKLDVNGSVRIGADATACTGTNAGAMRFNTPNVEYCNGTTWAAFGTSGAAVASAQITDGTIVNADVSATANIDATKLGTGVVDNTEFSYLNGVTSSIQTQLSGKQASDATLTSLAAYSTNGILVQTAADTFVGRSIAGTANRVTVTNGDGVAGNPTINIPTALLPSPVVGDVGKFLKATAADTSVWTALSSSDITTALGFTPINKAGDTVASGTFTYNGAAVLRTLDPIGPTDVATKQYVDGFGQWTAGGGNVYRTSGNVGIGTTTPAALFEVLAPTTGDISRFSNFGANTRFSIQSPTGGDRVNLDVSENSTGSANKNFTFSTGATERVRISASGNVGIGTTGPSEKLHVSGKILANNGTPLYIDSNATATIFANTANIPMTFQTNNTERMRIDGSGNVGIGTSSPSATSTLHISGANPSGVKIHRTNGDNSNIEFSNTEGVMYAGLSPGENFGIGSTVDLSNAHLTVTPVGRVGVGTISPNSTLDVAGVLTKNGMISKHLAYNVATATNVNITLPTGGTTLADGYVYKFNLITQGTATVTGASYIVYQTGVGTWAAKLVSINGNTSNHPLLQLSGTNVQIYHNHASSYAIAVVAEATHTGNITVASPHFFGLDGALTNIAGSVGIGTSTPQSKLDVNGSVRVGADATACSAANAGAMRFNTPNVEFCNGTAWAAFDTSGSAVASAQITDGTIVNADVSATANIAATKLGTGVVDNTEFNYLDGVTSSIQTQLNGKQTSDATLTSLAAYNTNGILVQTAADTFVGRSIAGTANRVTITNGDGVAGNPTINIPTALLPSPVVGDVGKFLKATAADTSVWTALSSSDITTALGFTPVNKAGDTMATGTFTFNGTAVLRTLDPVGLTDVATKQYVDGFGQWIKSGSDIYRSTGNVGIGTSAPDRKLHVVKANNSSSIRLDGFTAGTNMTPVMGIGSDFGSLIEGADNGQVVMALRDNDNNDGFRVISGGGNFMTDSVYDTPVLTALALGNVGIGTAYPLKTLSVEAAADPTIRISEGGSTTSYTDIVDFAPTQMLIRKVTATGDNMIDINPISSDGVSRSSVRLFRETNSTGTKRFMIHKGDGSPTIDTQIGVGENSWLNLAGGNVGIGTNTPSAKLDIAGGNINLDIATGFTSDVGAALKTGAAGMTWQTWPGDNIAASFIANLFDNSAAFFVANNGNVGVATTAPGGLTGWTQNANARVLEVSGNGTQSANSDGILSLTNNRATPTTGDQLGAIIFGSKLDPGGIHAGISSYNSGTGGVNGFGATLEFVTKPDNVASLLTRMLITPAGNVGIGTTTPTHKLSIFGSSVASGAAQTNISAFTGNGINIAGSVSNSSQDALTYQGGGGGGGAGIAFRRGASFDTYMDFYTNNTGTAGAITQAMTINNISNVGIGIASPLTRTHIVKPYTVNGGQPDTAWGVYKDDMTLLLDTGGTRTINRGGGIGFSNSDGFVLGAIKGAATNSTGTEYGGYLGFYTTGSGSGGGLNGYERMRIDQSGFVGMGTTGPWANLHVNSNTAAGYTMIVNQNAAAGGQAWTWYSSSTGAPLGANQMCFGALGVCLMNLTTAGNMTISGTLAQNSDIRLKRDIDIIPNALDSLTQLDGVTYYWKEPTKGTERQIGLIAQDVEKVFPEAVKTNKQGLKSVAYQNLVAPIVQSIKEIYRDHLIPLLKNDKEQNRRIASLEKENALLRQKDVAKEQELKALKEYLCSKDPKAAICKNGLNK